MSDPQQPLPVAFSSMPRASIDDLPIWFPCRYVLKRIRSSVIEFLERAQVTPGARVLDFGCGNCPNEPYVLARKAIYVGADMAGNAHADVLIEPDGRVAAESGQYDVVLSTQVLEHVPDPLAYLREARRLLRPGGKLILSTHGIWVYHPGPYDYWRWTLSGLHKTLEDAGYRVLFSRGLVGLMAAGIQLFQEYVEPRIPKFLRKPFTTFMQGLISLIDRVHGPASLRADAMIYVVLAEPISP